MSELLNQLLESEGLTEEEAMNIALIDSVVPGICEGCREVTTSVEPDQRKGYCESCGAKKVISLTELLMDL